MNVHLHMHTQITKQFRFKGTSEGPNSHSNQGPLRSGPLTQWPPLSTCLNWHHHRERREAAVCNALQKSTRHCMCWLWGFRKCFIWGEACASAKCHKFSVYNDTAIGKNLKTVLQLFWITTDFSSYCLKLKNYNLFLQSFKYSAPHPEASRKGRVGTAPENGLRAKLQYQDFSSFCLPCGW